MAINIPEILSDTGTFVSYLCGMKRSGYADLPLHGGRVPKWLTERMIKPGGAVIEAVVQE